MDFWFRLHGFRIVGLVLGFRSFEITGFLGLGVSSSESCTGGSKYNLFRAMSLCPALSGC